jgi:hypothetical protein
LYEQTEAVPHKEGGKAPGCSLLQIDLDDAWLIISAAIDRLLHDYAYIPHA